MHKAGGTISIIAGIFGILAAIATLLFGGLATAFEADKAGTVVGLGWGGVIFSFLVIVFGAIAFTKPKVASIGLVVSSILGAVLGGTLVAVFMVLSLIGGVLCLFGIKSNVTEQVVLGGADNAQLIHSERPAKQFKSLLWGAVAALAIAVFIVRITAVKTENPEKNMADVEATSASEVQAELQVAENEVNKVSTIDTAQEKSSGVQLVDEVVKKESINDIAQEKSSGLQPIDVVNAFAGNVMGTQAFIEYDNLTSIQKEKYYAGIKQRISNLTGKIIDWEMSVINVRKEDGYYSLSGNIELGTVNNITGNSVVVKAQIRPNTPEEIVRIESLSVDSRVVIKGKIKRADDETTLRHLPGATYLVILDQAKVRMLTEDKQTRDQNVSRVNEQTNLKIAETEPPTLDDLDYELNRVYKDLMARLPAENKAVLKRDEIAWIRSKENECGSNTECLAQRTESRIKVLKKLASGAQ